MNVLTSEYYEVVMKQDTDEHESCSFQWDCENCSKGLCLRMVAVADFPSAFGHFKLIGFTNNKDKKDHTAVVKGDVVKRGDVLTRIHSSCLTGDAFGSMRCDCGPQLDAALMKIEEEGLGVLIYMQQEGRGIGLTNKIRAYMLQDQGLDTYDANVHLGFKPDARDYELSAAMLDRLGVKSVRLLTNNVEKVEGIEKFSIKVTEMIPLELPANIHNRKYLETKRDRFDHKIKVE